MSTSASGRLLILRHAHSSWALPGQRDHERPLDDRGRREAQEIGAAFGALDMEIHEIVTSTAVRAAETLAIFKDALAREIATQTSDDLYALGPDAYLAAARRSGVGCLLLVGHNPMVEEAAASLSGDGDPEALRILQSGFRTAGLAIIEFQTPLSDAAPGAGHLSRFLLPGKR